MINVYPWGLSINVVEPITINKTRVRFLTYINKPEFIDAGVGGKLHKVEMEDEEIVESIQSNLSSRAFKRGKYSPTMEKGVHHFHRLITKFINE